MWPFYSLQEFLFPNKQRRFEALQFKYFILEFNKNDCRLFEMKSYFFKFWKNVSIQHIIIISFKNFDHNVTYLIASAIQLCFDFLIHTNYSWSEIFKIYTKTQKIFQILCYIKLSSGSSQNSYFDIFMRLWILFLRIDSYLLDWLFPLLWDNAIWRK